MLVLLGLTAGCVSEPRPEDVILDSPAVSIYLERAGADNFQATHPVTLSPALMGRVLKGVLVAGRKTTLQTIFAEGDPVERAFSDEEIAVLAPLLVKALARAKPAQQVHFKIAQPPRGPRALFSMSDTGGAAVGSSEPVTYGPKLEYTSGTLYVFRPSLHLTLTEFRKNPTRPDSINGPNRRYPNAGGLDRIEILFSPEAALQPESRQEPSLLGEPHLTPIILDYERLAGLPEPKFQPAPPPTAGTPAKPATAPGEARPGEKEAVTSTELQRLKESLTKQEQELKALKEEIRSLRGGQEGQPAQPAKPKGQKQPAP